jgi:UDP-N-acetylmuramoylalanine--D-glutamate ligase
VLLFSRKQSLEEGVFVQKGMIQANWSGRRLELMSIQEIRLPGSHNLENVLAAATVGLVLGLEPQSMVQTFQSFAGVEHRLELVRQWNGVSFYNDSKATNIDSASQALQAFTEPLLLIMGGQDKGGDFEKLHPLISGRVKLLILIGSAGDQIAGQLQGAAEIVRARDMKEAVRFAQQGSIPGDVVLLSPGCASFDMFDDFEHRGRAFKQAVEQLGSVPAPSDGSQKQTSQNRDEPEHPSREHTG